MILDVAVNPSQLCHEMGGAALCFEGALVDGLYQPGSDVTSDAVGLAAAVAVHVADAEWVDPDYLAPVVVSIADRVEALPDPTSNFAGFKTALAEILA